MLTMLSAAQLLDDLQSCMSCHNLIVVSLYPACTRAQREVEAFIGGVLLKIIGKAAHSISLIKSGLIAKEVYFPKCGYTMYYHERPAVIDDEHERDQDMMDQPTLLFFHGITGSSQDSASFIASLDIPPHMRIICPEQMGHGRDIENRLRSDPDNYALPTHQLICWRLILNSWT